MVEKPQGERVSEFYGEDSNPKGSQMRYAKARVYSVISFLCWFLFDSGYTIIDGESNVPFSKDSTP